MRMCICCRSLFCLNNAMVSVGSVQRLFVKQALYPMTSEMEIPRRPCELQMCIFTDYSLDH